MMWPVAASRQVTSLLMVDPNVLIHSYVADLRTGRGHYMGPHHAEFQGLNPRTAQPNMNRPLAAIQLPATRTENRDYAKGHEPAWEAQGRNVGFGDSIHSPPGILCRPGKKSSSRAVNRRQGESIKRLRFLISLTFPSFFPRPLVVLLSFRFS